MKTALALALAGLFPFHAHAALSIETSGRGQAVFVPYYTVDDGQSTLVTISNSSGGAKAVRVNFVEALNGQRVFTFNLYLGAFDTWTGAVFDPEGEGAPAHIASADASCVVPAQLDAPQPFRPFNYADVFPDGGPTGVDRTRRGAIEVIELGVLDAGVPSNDCEALVDRFFEGGEWQADPNADLSAPGGGLSASAMIVDAASGVAWQVPGMAIDGFAGRPQHGSPAEETPRITDPITAADGEDFEVLLADGTIATVDGARGPEAVSALFMASTAWGDFYVDPAMGASTAWLLSMPTRHAHVAELPGSLLGEDGSAAAPFTAAFDGGAGCEDAASRRWDLDGISVDDTLSPPLPPVELCAQTQLLGVSDAGPIVSASEAGRVRLDFTPGHELALPGDVLLRGLPVVGLRLSRFVNENVQDGVLANYTLGEPLSLDRAVRVVVAVLPEDLAAVAAEGMHVGRLREQDTAALEQA